MLAMQLGELRWGYAPAAAVRPDLVVVLTPCLDGCLCLMQVLEPLLVQALVPELAVEALDVAVLHRSSGLNEDVPDAVSLRPAHERATGELGTPEFDTCGMQVLDSYGTELTSADYKLCLTRSAGAGRGRLSAAKRDFCAGTSSVRPLRVWPSAVRTVCC